MSPNRYRLVVKGELGARYSSAFEEMTISAHDGITEITGAIIDPSHLQGLLERIAGLGLTLHSVTPLDAETGDSVADDDDWAANPHTTAGVGEPHPGTHLKGP